MRSARRSSSFAAAFAASCAVRRSGLEVDPGSGDGRLVGGLQVGWRSRAAAIAARGPGPVIRGGPLPSGGADPTPAAFAARRGPQ
jgi:hypothetical protein